ncbi:MAG: rRNA maturation RNase YbeY [Chloracidobacterium sp.]|nr:rRNA maturation RNase YbeY [Chloracidobacterium sp.]
MIDVINLQRKVRVEVSVIRTFVVSIFDNVDEAVGKTFSVALVSDRRMKELNKFFRGKDSTTDVLSFPHEADEFELPSADRQPPTVFLGDIVISAEQAQKQAAENGLSLENEIKQLILHGLLHLCGYDHETDNGEMNTRELELREKLNI